MPADEIVKAAGEWPADLIVIGSHGRGGVQRALLGSVADGVIRHASCPILVIRAAASGKTAKPPDGFDSRKATLIGWSGNTYLRRDRRRSAGEQVNAVPIPMPVLASGRSAD
ncbi:universal stress protein [Mesorhizobium tianshanense]|uniref:universal stress protein n=1 Tax=Mesorhizobium tianshanense TaxID=39844 RepID=UPI0011A21D6F